MIGLTVAAWSHGADIFPVEAAAVWIFAPFSSILTYEFAKALAHHPGSTQDALFGARHDQAPGGRPPAEPRREPRTGMRRGSAGCTLAIPRAMLGQVNGCPSR